MTYVARIRFQIGVSAHARRGQGREGLEASDRAKDVADHLMAVIDLGNPTAIGGVSWVDLFYALRRVGDPVGR